MERKLWVICLSILVLIMSISGCVNNEEDKSVGVKSLKIFFDNSSNSLNRSNIIANLNGNGYNVVQFDDSFDTDWKIHTYWNITDEEYKNNYHISNFTCSIHGNYVLNESDSQPYILIIIEPLTLSNNSKKQKDKELTKQAAYDIADIISVELDWDTHIYTISWMTMTSEGTYEEK